MTALPRSTHRLLELPVEIRWKIYDELLERPGDKLWLIDAVGYQGSYEASPRANDRLWIKILAGGLRFFAQAERGASTENEADAIDALRRWRERQMKHDESLRAHEPEDECSTAEQCGRIRIEHGQSVRGHGPEEAASSSGARRLKQSEVMVPSFRGHDQEFLPVLNLLKMPAGLTESSRAIRDDFNSWLPGRHEICYWIETRAWTNSPDTRFDSNGSVLTLRDDSPIFTRIEDGKFRARAGRPPKTGIRAQLALPLVRRLSLRVGVFESGASLMADLQALRLLSVESIIVVLKLNTRDLAPKPGGHCRIKVDFTQMPFDHLLQNLDVGNTQGVGECLRALVARLEKVKGFQVDASQETWTDYWKHHGRPEVKLHNMKKEVELRQVISKLQAAIDAELEKKNRLL